MDDKIKQTVTNEQATAIYEQDKKEFNDFVEGKKPTMDFARIQRLITSELVLNKTITHKTFLGFTPKQIRTMAEHPEHYGQSILLLMDFMYQKSGYMRRLIDYFSNAPKLNFYVDTEVTDAGFFEVKPDTLKRNYIKFTAQANKFNLSNVVHRIFKELYLHDICYAYIVEEKNDISYYFIRPRYCKIRGIVNGNVFQFAIDRSLLSDVDYNSFPKGLRDLLDTANADPNHFSNLVDVPIESSLCIKYNDHFLHLYPALFSMIPGILEIDDYEDLAKSKAINDAYKLLILEVPKNKESEIALDDKILSPFVSTALQVVNENIGVLPYPGEVKDIEFTSTGTDDNDIVENVINQVYAEQGVSEALMSGATSGSELKLSITNDSGDIFRIYRMLEDWMCLQMKMRGHLYNSYQFMYRIADITTFNWTEVVDEELKLAQASLPNKAKLCASAGINPAALLGNTFMENTVFSDIFDSFRPLLSSYTISNDEVEESEGESGVGAPEHDDVDLTPAGEATRENDTNDPDNRI